MDKVLCIYRPTTHHMSMATSAVVDALELCFLDELAIAATARRQLDYEL